LLQIFWCTALHLQEASGLAAENTSTITDYVMPICNAYVHIQYNHSDYNIFMLWYFTTFLLLLQ